MGRQMICTLVSCVAALGLTLVSCRKEQRQEEVFYPDVLMNVRMFSRESPDEEAAARLLFWDEEHLGKVAQGGGAPYYDCKLPGKINDYNEEATIFKTGKYYPLLNKRVYAMGFSPYELEPVEKDNYGTWYMPGCKGQDSTVLASNSITGSSVYPFRDPMEFRPATTRFIFRAKRAQNMAGNIYVRDITVTIPEDKIPNVLRWDEDGICYRAGYDEALDKDDIPGGMVISDPIVYDGNQLSIDVPVGLGTRYLVLPDDANTLDGITVKAQLSYSQDFPAGGDTWYRTWPDKDKGEDELSIKLRDENGGDVSYVEPGDSYIVTIVFDNDVFTIVAEQTDWENGGKIPVPIVPDRQTEGGEG